MNLHKLLTEQVNPATRDIDTKSTAEMLGMINCEDREVAEAVGKEIRQIAEAVDGIVGRLRNGGRLFYIGAGTSGRLGVLDAAECPPTFHVAHELVQGIIAGGERALASATEATEDDPKVGKHDLLARGFTGADALVGIAASGRTPYVLGAVAAARELGALTVGISCTPDSELSRLVAIPIVPLVGPEVIAGSTRMKAGTATKLVLNMISTAVMIQLGHVYGNLMVNVEPKNSKLEDRARRIVAEAAEVSYEDASELLRKARGSVKTAIVMSRLSLGCDGAAARLDAAGGRISKALQREKNG
jgi:N-acetylmuramic acid 6-phosphate etherase